MAEVFDNPLLGFEISRRLQLMIAEAAEAGAEALRGNLTGQGRSGRKYRHLPFRSSRAKPLEYPTEQFGDLLNDVDVRPLADPLGRAIGFFGPDQKKYQRLEFDPASIGGRKPLKRTFSDKGTQQAMLRAMAEADIS